LIQNGVTVQRAQSAFTVNGKNYPAGSYVVKTAQAFRPQVLDMFEPQDHPDDFAYPGAPPTPPYDIAGWTLAFQMGVQFDRVLDGFNGPFEAVDSEQAPPPAKVLETDGAVGFFLHHRTNDAYRTVNRILAAGEEVRRVNAPFTVERFEYPFTVISPPDLDKGGLRDKFDVLILADGAYGLRGPGTVRPDAIVGDQPPPEPADPGSESNIPEEYRGRRGAITTAKTGP